MYLIAYDHQFGFKNNHSTDICIDVFLAKSIMKYYTEHGSPVFTCFLDASKAFDRINHWTLFRKMIDSKMPLIIVRIIMFLYQSQLVALNGARLHVIFFRISNSVRQGGILSPKLFALYMKNLSRFFFVFPIVCGKVVYFHQNYAKSNKIIRTFSHCTIALLIKSCCIPFYCGYMWSDYK